MTNEGGGIYSASHWSNCPCGCDADENQKVGSHGWTPDLEAELRQRIRLEYINSLRRIELARCQGKEGFDSHALANAVSRRPGHEGMVVYHCRFCNRWHLGKSMYDANGRRRNKTLIDRDRAREIEQELNGRGGRRAGGRRVVPS